MVTTRKIKEQITKLDTMTNEECFKFVSKYFEYLLLDDYKEVFKNVKFLSSVNEVLHTRDIEPYHRVRCNNIIYYLIMESKKDEYRYKLLIMIGETLNPKEANLMLGIGIPYDLAVYIAVAAYSSMKPNVSIKRVNLLLAISFPSAFMSPQKVIEVYEELYTTCFSRLLSVNTFDTTLKNEIEEGADWITTDTVEINDAIRLATLHILESLPPQDIFQYLYMIAEQYGLENADPSKVRFSYHNLPKQFIKIPIIVEQLEGMDSYIQVP